MVVKNGSEDIFVEGLRKTKIELYQNRRYQGPDLNLIAPNYISELPNVRP
jgi:hypothetical protein